jgi:hypothetical protein
MKIKNFGKIIAHQSISGRRKYFFISLFFGIITMLSVVFLANAQGVALPTNVGLPSGNLTSVIANFTNWLLAIFGFLAIISFLVSGIMYLLSAGDDKAQEKAKKQMTWSIMGVVIGLVGLVVIYAVDMFLRGGGASFGTSSSSSYSSSISNQGSSSSSTNTTEWLGEGTNPKTGNRVFIDQQGNKFELINGSLTPMNDAGASYTPDSAFQP